MTLLQLVLSFIYMATSKKEVEKLFGDFFISRFNRQYNLDYKIYLNEDEAIKDGDIDIYAIGENVETLKLQVKTGEPALEAFWGKRKKEGSGWVEIDVDIKKLLIQIIQNAERKYSNKKELILLVGEKMQPIFDKYYANLLTKQVGNSNFKGIYLVKLPLPDGDPLYKGQVIAIKDIFGNNGKIL